MRSERCAGVGRGLMRSNHTRGDVASDPVDVGDADVHITILVVEYVAMGEAAGGICQILHHSTSFYTNARSTHSQAKAFVSCDGHVGP